MKSGLVQCALFFYIGKSISDLFMGLWHLFLFWNANVFCCWNVVFVHCACRSVTGVQIYGFLVSCECSAQSMALKRVPLECSEWSGLFVVGVLQKQISDTEEMQKPEDRSDNSIESSNIGNGIQLIIVLSWLRYTLREVPQIRCHSPRAVQENTLASSSLARRFYEHRQMKFRMW